jgi:hypothetical protein
MTVEDIQKRIAAIDAVKNDPEIAHSAEAELFKDVLRYIAKNKDHPGPLHYSNIARETLKVLDVEFPR